jgi:hypothetical protein
MEIMESLDSLDWQKGLNLKGIGETKLLSNPYKIAILN